MRKFNVLGFILCFLLITPTLTHTANVTHGSKADFDAGNSINLEMYGNRVSLAPHLYSLKGPTSEVSPFPLAIERAAGFVSGNRIFLGGGVNVTGTPGDEIVSISNDPNAPIWRHEGNLAIPGGKVSLLRSGKWVFSLMSGLQVKIWSRSFNSVTGFESSWRAERDGPAGLTESLPIVFDGSLYLFPNDGSSIIYRSAISTLGSLMQWKPVGSLPIALKGYGITVTPNGVLIAGGTDNSSTIRQEVYGSIITNDQIGWSPKGSLPRGLTGIGIDASAGVLSVVGGFDGATMRREIYMTSLGTDDGLGPWRNPFGLNQGVMNAAVFLLGNELFVVGGRTLAGPIKNVYMERLSYRSDTPAVEFNSTSDILSSFDSTIGSWPSFAVDKHKLYIAGSGGIIVADINEDGTIIQASSSSTKPGHPHMSYLFVCGKYLVGVEFVDGGANGETPRIWTSPLDGEGNPGTFTNVYTDVAYQFSPTFFAVGRRIFKAGGSAYPETPPNLNRFFAVNTIKSAQLIDDGTLSNFESEQSMPVPLAMFDVAFSQGRIYIVGGWSWSRARTLDPRFYSGTNNIYSSAFDLDGRLTGWRLEGTIPDAFHSPYGNYCQLFSDSEKIIIIGGFKNTSEINTANRQQAPTLYSADVSDNGTLSGWSSIGVFNAVFTNRPSISVNGRGYSYFYSPSTGQRMLVGLTKPMFVPKGVYEGPTLDLESPNSIKSISWEKQSQAAGAGLLLMGRSGAPGFSFSDWKPLVHGTALSPSERFFSYKATFSRGGVSNPAVLELLSVVYEKSNQNDPAPVTVTLRNRRSIARDGVTFDVASIIDGPVRCTIMDSGQNIIREFDTNIPAGQSTFVWDCKDQSGADVFSGIYWLQMNTSVGKIKLALAVTR